MSSLPVPICGNGGHIKNMDIAYSIISTVDLYNKKKIDVSCFVRIMLYPLNLVDKSNTLITLNQSIGVLDRALFLIL